MKFPVFRLILCFVFVDFISGQRTFGFVEVRVVCMGFECVTREYESS